MEIVLNCIIALSLDSFAMSPIPQIKKTHSGSGHCEIRYCKTAILLGASKSRIPILVVFILPNPRWTQTRPHSILPNITSPCSCKIFTEPSNPVARGRSILFFFLKRSKFLPTYLEKRSPNQFEKLLRPSLLTPLLHPRLQTRSSHGTGWSDSKHETGFLTPPIPYVGNNEWTSGSHNRIQAN